MRLSLLSLFLSFPGWLIAATTPESESTRTPMLTEPVGSADFVQMFVGMLVVLAVIFTLAWLMKRTGYVKPQLQGALKVLASVSVGQRERIVLVQAGDEQLLLGVAPGQVRSLHVLKEPINVADAADAVSFAQRLQEMLGKK